MPVETFSDISEKKQCEELREYMVSLKASIPPTPLDSYVTDLQQIISVCDIIFKVDKEQEVEMALNSIVSVLLQVDATKPEASALVASFCGQLAKAPNARQAMIAFRVLQNLFNGLTHFVQLRYRVYLTMIGIAGLSGHLRHIYNNLPQLKKWFPVDVVGAEKIQSLLRILHQTLKDNRQPEMASKVMVELLTTYTDENASQARTDAHQCIVSAIADPNTFLMDYLLLLKPVKFLEGELIHELLTIFVTENLTAYMAFYKANLAFITDTLKLSHEANTQKMRLLTFMQMAENKKDLLYADIQRELQLPAEQVEAFVIDVLKTKLVKAHIDQANRRVLVSSTMHRTFGRPQWQKLRDTLSKCAANMAQVRQTMIKHRMQFESIHA